MGSHLCRRGPQATRLDIFGEPREAWARLLSSPASASRNHGQAVFGAHPGTTDTGTDYCAFVQPLPTTGRFSEEEREWIVAPC